MSCNLGWRKYFTRFSHKFTLEAKERKSYIKLETFFERIIFIFRTCVCRWFWASIQSIHGKAMRPKLIPLFDSSPFPHSTQTRHWDPATATMAAMANTYRLPTPCGLPTVSISAKSRRLAMAAVRCGPGGSRSHRRSLGVFLCRSSSTAGAQGGTRMEDYNAAMKRMMRNPYEYHHDLGTDSFH